LKKSVPERLDWLSPSGEDGRPWALRQGWRRRRDQLDGSKNLAISADF
jgi:hypothetical protein